MKKIKRWLQLWDGSWSVPLIILLILLASYTFVKVWGPDVGIFPPGLMSAVFISALQFFAGWTVVNYIIYFYHRKWFNHYYKNNDLIKEDFNKLPSWARLLFVPFMQLVLFLLFIWSVAQLI